MLSVGQVAVNMRHRKIDAYRLLIADVYELAGESRRSGEELARRAGSTAARWHVLSVVSERACTVAAAARRLGLTRQSVQRVVDDLAREGHVELSPNPEHARAPLVSLTRRGRATLSALSDAGAADRAAVLRRAGVGADELDTARAVLRRLVAALRADEPQT